MNSTVKEIIEKKKGGCGGLGPHLKNSNVNNELLYKLQLFLQYIQHIQYLQ